MGSKLLRRVGAHGAIVAMLFAQFAIVAYACPVQSRGAPAATPHVAMDVEVGQNPCASMAGTTETPQANACEVHCNDGVTLPAQPEMPQVVLTALPVPDVALAQHAVSGQAARTPYAALPGAPPLALQFCRLLI